MKSPAIITLLVATAYAQSVREKPNNCYPSEDGNADLTLRLSKPEPSHPLRN